MGGIAVHVLLIIGFKWSHVPEITGQDGFYADIWKRRI